MSFTKSMLGAVVGLVLWAPLVRSGETPENEARRLVEVLKSDAKIFDKAKACERLAVIATKEAVPVLAGLLADEQLAHYARYALEPIPDPSVDDALREAMGRLQGKLRVGVINSIGVRKDAKALDALRGLLGDADVEVAAAAAAAMGRIGRTESARALKQSLATARGSLRDSVAEACLVCAEVRLAEGKGSEAAALYDAVRTTDLPEHLRLAGLRGAILARGGEGLSLFEESLEGSRYGAFAAALSVSREMRGPEVTRALVARLGKLPPEKKALVIKALGDRGDGAALPAALEAARSGPMEVRVAAIRALEALGDASALPVLLEASADTEAVVADAARETLSNLEGKGVDEALVGMLDTARGKLRPVVIELVGRRRLASALPALRKAADAEDEAVRVAALKALGDTAGLEDLVVLTARVGAAKAPAESAAALEALKAASRRMPDRDACAAKLAESLASAPVEAKIRLLEVFIPVGGPKALAVVAASMKDPDGSVRDAAARTLGEWKSEDAALLLLTLTKAAGNDEERARAFDAFNHIVRSLGFPKEQRIGICKEALDASRSDGERKQVVETLANIPAGETYAVLLPLLANAAIKEDACAAAVRIAERAVRFAPAPVAEAMKQVMATTGNADLSARAKKLFEQAGGKS